jgi:hypothetical protein
VAQKVRPTPTFCLVLQALLTPPKLLLQLHEVEFTYWLTWGWGGSRGWSHGCGAPRLQIATKHTWLWNQCFFYFVTQSLEVEVPDSKNQKDQILRKFYTSAWYTCNRGWILHLAILYKHIMAPTPVFWYIQTLHGTCKYCISNKHRLNLVDSNHRVPDTGWYSGASW